MICSAYARVSTTDQDCAYQLKELEEYVERRKWILSKEYVDSGFSGKKNNRPALVQLMADASRKKFDCVLVWKIDRFGRSANDLAQNIMNLRSHGVRFIAISQSIDTDDSNPGARLMLNMLAAFAQFESEMIRERTMAGLSHARKYGTKSGNPIGRPKKIFRRDEALELRAQGVPFREVARRLGVGLGTVLRACSVPKSGPETASKDGDIPGVAGLPEASLY